MARDDDPGVPLGHYREHDAGVLLICVECQLQRVLDLEEVIERLDRRGLNGASVGIRELRRHLRAPCIRCGSRRLETRPWFPPGKPKS
jgi:hypothetical protein